jgi:peptidyl-prolyl cis-trans isomerase C
MNTTVVVGSREISPHEIGLEAQYHPAKTWEQAYHAAQRALVLKELLLLECVARGVRSERPRDERAAQTAIDALLSEAIPVVPIGDPECLAFYEQNPDKFRGEPLYDVSHLLLGAAVGDPVSLEAARSAAEELRLELIERPELFERRARERSACPSATSGGRLGQVSPGETEPEFEAALCRLLPGELSPVIETRHGCHLVRLEAYAEPKRLPFDLVRSKIRAFLEEMHFKAALQTYVLELAARHGVRGFDLMSEAPRAAFARPAVPRRLRVVQN